VFLFGDGDGWRSVAATGKTSGGEIWDRCAWTVGGATPIVVAGKGKRPLNELDRCVDMYKDAVKRLMELSGIPVVGQNQTVESNTWQPIETAPTEDTIVIVKGFYDRPAPYGREIMLAAAARSQAGVMWWRDNNGYGFVVQCYPTHWLKMPS